MAGPWRHPNGVFYLRREVPKDLWESRARLLEFGVKLGGKEVRRSLNTRDPRAAAEAYVQVAAQQEALWADWREALASGPTVLSERNAVAIAGERAKAFLLKHQDDPAAAPNAPTRSEPALSAGLREQVLSLPQADQQRLGEAAAKAVEVVAKGGSLGALYKEWEADPVLSLLRQLLAEPIRETLEAEHGAELDRLLVEKGEAITRDSRAGVLLAATRLQAMARESLRTMSSSFDFRQPVWVRGLPEYQPSSRSVAGRRAKGKDRKLTLTALLDHKAETQSVKPTTVTNYRSALADFAKLTGHDDARRVTREDVRKWRDHLQRRGLSPKTVNDSYLAAIKATLRHGVKEFDLPQNVADDIRDERPAPPPAGSKGYSDEQAKTILAATFKGSTKAHSIPHQRALFWVPWICAYTGLRVSEVTQFQGRNLREDGGIPVMMITPEDGSTKGGNAWATGIHPHLIQLGLLDMFRAVGDGPAFYVPYPADTNLMTVKNHRAKDTADRIAGWIKDEVGISPPGGRPNHAWRHTFTTLSRKYGMDKEARDFMMGSRSQTDAREGYGDWPPSVLTRELEKLPRFDVEDTGWRPALAKVLPATVRNKASVPKRRLHARTPRSSS